MIHEVHGQLAPGFEPLREAFATTLGDASTGAALSVFLGGRPVVDLWGGIADERTKSQWSETTVSVVFSCTKGLMSILAAQLVEQGLLDYDAPVARYWPEFAAAGKSNVRVRHLLNHQAGLSAPRQTLSTADILEWDVVVDALANQEPLWPLGSGYAYHAITHGWLVGEVLRRASGQSVSDLFRDAVAKPLEVAAWIGLPQTEAHNVAYMVVGRTLAEESPSPASADGPDWLERAMTLGEALPSKLVSPTGGFNDPRLWAAQIPGAGGIASARALAKIWSATVRETDGIRLLDGATVKSASTVQTEGEPVFPVPSPWPRWGMGFQIDSEARRYLTSEGFGHDGAGGQVAFAEPRLGLAFAYTTNLMEAGDSRATSIIDVLRQLPILSAARA